MKTLLTSIVVAAGLLVSSSAEAHPHPNHHHRAVVDPRPNIMYVWVWIPATYVYGDSLGGWYRVKRGSKLHRIYGQPRYNQRPNRRR